MSRPTTSPDEYILLPFGPGRGSGQLAGREDLVDVEFVTQVKGTDLMVGMFVEQLGLAEEPAT